VGHGEQSRVRNSGTRLKGVKGGCDRWPSARYRPEADVYKICENVRLVRGDIYLQSGSFHDALANYDSALEGFELLRAQGVSPDFEIASALINSASALTGLERRAEARDRLLRAKVQAAKLPNDDPRAQFLVDAASKFLDRLDAVALPLNIVGGCVCLKGSLQSGCLWLFVDVASCPSVKGWAFK